MEGQSNDGLKRQRERKRRVKRLKLGIVLTLLGWVLISMVLSVVLLVRTHSLEKKLEMLIANNNQNVQEEVLDQDEKKVVVSEAELYDNDSAESDMDVTTDEENILAPSVTIDDSNLAEVGDTPKVYLTFDDGPSENTSEILDILKENGIKATFFVVAKEDDDSAKLYQRIVNEGHTLALHSYTHQYTEVYNSLDSFKNDVDSLRKFVYDITGIECKYYRFPGGSSNRVSGVNMPAFIGYLNEQNITYFDWNVSNGDATSQAYTSDELVSNVMNDVTKYKTSIVLMHDAATKHTTVESLPNLIAQLKTMGAEILPIDDNTTLVQHVHVDSVD